MSEDTAWQEIEALLTLLEGVREDETLPASSRLSIDAEDLRARIYDRLAAGLRPLVGGKIPEPDAAAVLNEAIYEVFRSYAHYRARYRVRDFARVVLRNKVSAYFRQRGRYVAMEDEALEKLLAEKETDPASHGYRENATSDTSLEDLFGLIRVGTGPISEKEFLVFVLKAANGCLAKKLSEDRLAALVGLKRTTFRDVYQKARDKIYEQWRQSSDERRGGRGEETL